MLQHAVYCLRQAALIHVERLWEENSFTAEGRVLHSAVDRPGERYSRGVRRVSPKRVRIMGGACSIPYLRSRSTLPNGRC